jgi:hypothetical protein
MMAESGQAGNTKRRIWHASCMVPTVNHSLNREARHPDQGPRSANELNMVIRNFVQHSLRHASDAKR